MPIPWTGIPLAWHLHWEVPVQRVWLAFLLLYGGCDPVQGQQVLSGGGTGWAVAGPCSLSTLLLSI